MALNTFTGATDNNWGTATNWSQGTVPTNTDTYTTTFNGASPNCTVNTSARFAQIIDFTAYTNTITMTNSISVSGNVTLGASMVISGAGSLNVAATATMTSNGKTWPNAMTFSVASTKTLADNWTITRTVTITNSGNVFTGNTMNIAEGLTGAGSCSGTTVIVLNGTGTWNTTGTVQNSLTFNTAGTITVSGTILYNTGTLTYTAGTVTTTSSTLSIGATGTTLNTSGITWNNVIYTTGTQTCTLSSDLNLSGTLIFSNITMTVTINGAFYINVTGGVTHNNGCTINGTCLGMNLTGTGTYNNNGTDFQYFPLTINTAGTITFVNGINLFGTTFTYTAGTVDWGTALIQTGGAGMVLTLGSQVPFKLHMIGNAGYTVTLSSDLTVSNAVSMGTNGPLTINGNTLKINGNLSIVNNVAISGTTNFLLNGSGVWSCNGIGVLQNNLTIDTFGTIVINSVRTDYNTGTFTYVKGNVIANYGTLVMGTGTFVDVHKIIWGNVRIAAGQTVTMNGFFNGIPGTSTRVKSTTTANYTVLFTTTTTKKSFFTKVSNCTVTQKGQLCLMSANSNYGGNVGVTTYEDTSFKGFALSERTSEVGYGFSGSSPFNGFGIN